MVHLATSTDQSEDANNMVSTWKCQVFKENENLHNSQQKKWWIFKDSDIHRLTTILQVRKWFYSGWSCHPETFLSDCSSGGLSSNLIMHVWSVYNICHTLWQRRENRVMRIVQTRLFRVLTGNVHITLLLCCPMGDTAKITGNKGTTSWVHCLMQWIFEICFTTRI